MEEAQKAADVAKKFEEEEKKPKTKVPKMPKVPAMQTWSYHVAKRWKSLID